MAILNLDDTIRAFQCCVKKPPDCANCPEQGPGFGIECCNDVKASVLRWLKAQEPHEARLLTADEVQHLQDRQTICVEQLVSRTTDKHGYVTGCAWGVMCNKDNNPENGLLVSMLGTFFPNTITKIPYEVMFQREDDKGHYIVQFRFWTDRPTTEQSKAVAWE